MRTRRPCPASATTSASWTRRSRRLPPPRDAARALGRWRLGDCALYVTIEPCAMCAGAAILARIPLVVFAAPEEKTGAGRSTVELFDDPRALHRPRWRLGARRAEVERMLAEFFAARRGPAEVEG